MFCEESLYEKKIQYELFMHPMKIQLNYFRDISVLSKFVGPVGQSDISYECPTKNVRVPDQMSDRKYKNIHLVD